MPMRRHPTTRSPPRRTRGRGGGEARAWDAGAPQARPAPHRSPQHALPSTAPSPRSRWRERPETEIANTKQCVAQKAGPKRGPTPAMASSLVDSMASLCDSSLPSGSGASASFPVRTSTFTATILGVHTQFVLSAYANRIFIVVSQTANFGTLVRAARASVCGARSASPPLAHP